MSLPFLLGSRQFLVPNKRTRTRTLSPQIETGKGIRLVKQDKLVSRCRPCSLRRRRFLLLGLHALLASACRSGVPERWLREARKREEEHDSGRLHARPAPTSTGTASPGVQALGLRAERDALVYVPPNYRPSQPAPLVLMLHGAGGDARGGLAPLLDLAESHGSLLLAPASLGRTWDLLLGSFGPDVTHIGHALTQIFSRYSIDTERLAIQGFSDGASYALSLGLTNGDLFTHILAFSPGFYRLFNPRGTPRIFVSHGVDDAVLPIDRTSRQIVPRLREEGYEVQYREFPGGHAVPGTVAEEAVEWFL